MSFAILDNNGRMLLPIHTDNPQVFANGQLPEAYRNSDASAASFFYSWKDWFPQANHQLAVKDGGLRTLTYGKATAYLRIGFLSGHNNALEISVTSPDYDDFLVLLDMVTEYVGGKVISMPKKDDQSMVTGLRNDIHRLKGYLMNRYRSLRHQMVRAAY